MSSRWARTAFCVNCDHSLTWSEEVYSDGVCPHCGYSSDSTICDTVVRAARFITTRRPHWLARLFGAASTGYWEYKS